MRTAFIVTRTFINSDCWLGPFLVPPPLVNWEAKVFLSLFICLRRKVVSEALPENKIAFPNLPDDMRSTIGASRSISRSLSHHLSLSLLALSPSLSLFLFLFAGHLLTRKSNSKPQALMREKIKRFLLLPAKGYARRVKLGQELAVSSYFGYN